MNSGGDVHQANEDSKSVDPGNDHVLINNDSREQPNDIDIDENSIKTFSYYMNEFIIVKPVIGLTNYSGEDLMRIKEMYISYKENFTISIKNKHSEEKLQRNEHIDSSDIDITASNTRIEFYDYEFEKWNNRRLVDGLLCQNNTECQWLDLKLKCQTNVKLDFNASVSTNW